MEEAIKAIEYLTKACKGEVFIPRIDFVPVINAKWEKHSCCDFYRCSNCKSYWDSDLIENCNVNYCPTCGAKMNLQEEQNE